MGVAQKFFAGRKPASLALDFDAETITLLAADADAPQGWSPLASTLLTSDTFSEEIEALRSLAADRSPDCTVDLWLPADQILNTHLELKSARPWNRTALAKATLAERFGLDHGEINVDLARAPGEVWATCAVESNVIDEARNYARSWGFTPQMVTTRHADAAFSTPPDLTNDRNRRPLYIGAAALAAASIALAVLFWPVTENETTVRGPDRIAMASAAALTSPPVQDAGALALAGDPEGQLAFQTPNAPRPDYTKTAALSGGEAEFTAVVKSPSQNFPNFLSIDFSLPRVETATPIYANVAYSAPALGHNAPMVDAIEQYFVDAGPGISPGDLPSLTLGDGSEPAALRPSGLTSFDVAALGEAPRALRTQELLLDGVDIQPSDNDAEPDQTQLIADPDTPEEPVIGAVDLRAPVREPDTDSQDEVEEDAVPGPGSVTAAPKPGKRPENIDMTPGPGAVAVAPLARSRPKSIKPKAVVVARNTSSAKTVRAPARGKPTGRGLAGAATLKNALSFDKTSLLGVFGTSKNRRALLRMSNGRLKRVSQGEVIDGWVISRIQATSMRMTRGAEVRNLNLVR